MSFNLDKCIEQLLKCEILTENTIKELCEKLKEQLIEESNVISIKSPITIVGDIHGQFHDLLEIFRIGGQCPDTNYLFLGNYVNRGYFNIETISLLICLKLRFPNRIILLRGNHETRALTQVYGFYSECIRKYGSANVWSYFVDLFDYFNIAALIDDRIVAIHGGLSGNILSLDQIRVLNRFQEIPAEGPLTDLLWSDPDPEKEGISTQGRSAGCFFGQDIVNKFLKTNRVEHIVRSHQLCLDGYQILFNNSLSTIWSAPNYCLKCGNVATILEISDKLEKYYNTFCESPESRKLKIDVDILKEFPDYYM